MMVAYDISFSMKACDVICSEHFYWSLLLCLWTFEHMRDKIVIYLMLVDFQLKYGVQCHVLVMVV